MGWKEKLAAFLDDDWNSRAVIDELFDVISDRLEELPIEVDEDTEDDDLDDDDEEDE